MDNYFNKSVGWASFCVFNDLGARLGTFGGVGVPQVCSSLCSTLDAANLVTSLALTIFVLSGVGIHRSNFLKLGVKIYTLYLFASARFGGSVLVENWIGFRREAVHS